MSRQLYPLAVADLSAFARSLRTQLEKTGETPGHVEMLNMLCRAAGFRNYQHFRASIPQETAIEQPLAAVVSTPADPVFVASSTAGRERVVKVARHFDLQGRMLRWPAKASQQEMCLWLLWSRIPARTILSEREIVALLNVWHLFSDPAILRRALFENGLVHRTPDGREYRRIERKPPPELSLLLSRFNAAHEL